MREALASVILADNINSNSRVALWLGALYMEWHWRCDSGHLGIARDIRRTWLQWRVESRARGAAYNRSTGLVWTLKWRIVVRNPDSLDLDPSLKSSGSEWYVAGISQHRMQLYLFLDSFAFFCLGMLLGGPSVIDENSERIDEHNGLVWLVRV